MYRIFPVYNVQFGTRNLELKSRCVLYNGSKFWSKNRKFTRLEMGAIQWRKETHYFENFNIFLCPFDVEFWGCVLYRGARYMHRKIRYIHEAMEAGYHHSHTWHNGTSNFTPLDDKTVSHDIFDGIIIPVHGESGYSVSINFQYSTLRDLSNYSTVHAYSDEDIIGNLYWY